MEYRMLKNVDINTKEIDINASRETPFCNKIGFKMNCDKYMSFKEYIVSRGDKVLFRNHVFGVNQLCL